MANEHPRAAGPVRDGDSPRADAAISGERKGRHHRSGSLGRVAQQDPVELEEGGPETLRYGSEQLEPHALAPAATDEVHGFEPDPSDDEASKTSEVKLAGSDPVAADSDVAAASALIEAARNELERRDDPAERARLHLALATLYEARLQDAQAALVHYREACERDPRQTAYLRALRRAYHARQNWPMVFELIEREQQQTTDDAEVAGLLSAKGVISAIWLSDRETARAAFSAALQRDPHQRIALLFLRHLGGLGAVATPQLRDVYRAAIDAADDPRERAVLYGELGALQRDAEGDSDAALHSFERAIADDPGHAGARAALAELYRSNQQWKELVELYAGQASRGADASGPTNASIDARMEAVQLCRERLSQPERALELLADLSGEMGGLEREALEQRVQLLEQAGRFEELVAAERQRLVSCRDRSARAALHARVAVLLEHRLERPREALAHYEQAVQADPAHRPALRALRRLAREEQQWDVLIDAERRELQACEQPERRAACLIAMAELWERALRDVDQAVACYREALHVCPGDARARRGLQRLLVEVGAADQLVELLEAQLRQLDGQRAADVLHLLAMVCDRSLDDPKAALAYLRRALELPPSELWPLHEAERLCRRVGDDAALVALLDRQADVWRQRGDDPTPLALEAAAICRFQPDRTEEALERYRALSRHDDPHPAALIELAALLETRGEWAELADVYERLVDRADGERERAGVRMQQGELCELQLGQLDRAISCYEEAASLGGGHALAEHGLARAYRIAGRLEDLARLREHQVESCSDPEQRAELWCELAEVRRRLERAPDAIEAYRQALEQRPDHARALRGLCELLQADQRDAEQAAALERAVEAVRDPKRRVALLERLAQIHERLGRRQQAIDRLEEALELEPEDREIIAALQRLYPTVEDHQGLLDLLKHHAELCDDETDKSLLLSWAATVAEVHQPLSGDSAALHGAAARHAPGDRQLLWSWLRVSAASRDFREVARATEALLRVLPDGVERFAVLLRRGLALEAQGALPGAEQALAEARNTGAWLASRELRRLYESQSRWQDVADELEHEVQLARDPAQRVAALRCSAEVCAGQLGDHERALVALERLVELAPRDEEAAARLEQLLIQRRAWQRLVEVTRRRLAAMAETHERPERARLLVRMGWIQREHLRRPADAIDTLRQAVRDEPHSLPTLQTLAELYEAQQQWREAVAIYRRIAALSNDPELLAGVQLRLGELYEERLGEQREALASYQNVLAVAPDHRTSLRRLEQLLRRLGDWDGAVDVLTRLLAVEQPPRARAALLLELADIYEQGFADPAAAAAQLEEAAQICPADPRVIERLGELYGRLEAWPRLVAALQRYLELLPEEQQVRGLQVRGDLASLLHRLGRVAEAAEQYREIVEIDPTDVAARLACARLAWEQGRVDLAMADYREVLDLEPLHDNALHELAELCGSSARSYTERSALELLAYAGMATPGTERRRRELVERTRAGSTRALPSEIDDLAIHPGEHPAGRALLACLSEVAHRIRPVRLERLGVSRADRLGPRSGDPLRIAVDELAGRLALPHEVDIYLADGRRSSSEHGRLELLPTDPPALLADSSLLERRTPREMRFAVAELLAWVRAGTWIAYELDGKGLEHLVTAACRAVESGRAPRGGEPPALGETALVVQRALGRRGRRSVEAAVQRLSTAGRPSYTEWARCMRFSALHIALLLTDDLGAAFEHLARADPGLCAGGQPRELAAAIKGNAAASELVRYWLSEELAGAQKMLHEAV